MLKSAIVRIEQNAPSTSTCDCCGGITTSLTRYVYDDGGARAVYFARFSDNHPDRIVSALVSIGLWGEGSSGAHRVAFALDVRGAGGSHEVCVRDARESFWAQKATLLGRMLSREEALSHGVLQEAYAIIDQACLDDHPLRTYVRG